MNSNVIEASKKDERGITWKQGDIVTISYDGLIFDAEILCFDLTGLDENDDNDACVVIIDDVRELERESNFEYDAFVDVWTLPNPEYFKQFEGRRYVWCPSRCFDDKGLINLLKQLEKEVDASK